MNWKDILKMEKERIKYIIENMEDSLKREMGRSLSGLSLDDKQDIERLRRQAKGLIQSLKEHYEGKRSYSGEIEQFDEDMDMIEYIRTDGGLF